MSVKTLTNKKSLVDNTSREDVLSLARALSFVDQNWLMQQLARLAPLEEEEELPESTTLDKAIEFYLADECSLGRAAELAGVTRWDIMGVLKERQIPIIVEPHLSAKEIDELAKKLDSKSSASSDGFLYPEAI